MQQLSTAHARCLWGRGEGVPVGGAGGEALIVDFVNTGARSIEGRWSTWGRTYRLRDARLYLRCGFVCCCCCCCGGAVR